MVFYQQTKSAIETALAASTMAAAMLQQSSSTINHSGPFNDADYRRPISKIGHQPVKEESEMQDREEERTVPKGSTLGKESMQEENRPGG